MTQLVAAPWIVQFTEPSATRGRGTRMWVMGAERNTPSERMKKIPPREFQVLALLERHRREQGAKGELNGRNIAAEFEKEENSPIPYGTLYTLLAALEQTGWVNSRKDKCEGRWNRWFHITDAGAEALEGGRAYYRCLANFAADPQSTSPQPGHTAEQ